METHQVIQVQPPEPKSWPKVAIIVLNWNGWQDTLECLKSVGGLTYPNYLTIVVDNGSWDDSVERIKAWVTENLNEGHLIVEYTQGEALEEGEGAKGDALEVVPPRARVVLIQNEENLGFTGGNNVAIDYALHRNYPAEYVFLLNNDAMAEPDCLTTCVQVAQSSGAAVVGATLKNTQGHKVFAGTPCSLLNEFFPLHVLIPYRPPSPVLPFWDVGRVSGAAMLVHREVLERIKSGHGYYLNPAYFLYCEETLFCYQVRQLGHKVVMARDALVCHAYGKSAGPGSRLTFYYIARNKIRMANQVLPWHWKVLFHLWYGPTRVIRAIQKVARRQPQVSVAILQGLFDGYRGVTGKWKHHPG